MAEVEELDLVRKLREQCYAGRRVFKLDSGELGVFDPEWSRIINVRNYSGLLMPDRFVDVLRRRTSRPVLWGELRTDWSACLKRFAEPAGMLPVAERMSRELDAVLGQTLDFNELIQRITSRALIPVIIDGLRPRDFAQVAADQDFKNNRLLQIDPAPASFRKELHSIWVQIQSGLAVRREIRRRLRDPQRTPGDMTDPVVRRYADLGMDRAVEAVTTVLTAIAGPPGAAAIGVVYSYLKYPEFATRIDAELKSSGLEELLESPRANAPFCNAFIKEVLRLWSPPLFMTRPVRTQLEIDQHQLEPGQRFTLSLFLMHHDPESWEAPESFDPDRWGEQRQRKGAYCPFGFAPKSCVGANVGVQQLLIWLYLISNHYQLCPDSDGHHVLKRSAITLPVNFIGQLRRRQRTKPDHER